MILIWTGEASGPLHTFVMFMVVMKYFAPQILQLYIDIGSDSPLPTATQFAWSIGMAIFMAVVTVYAMWDLLFPPSTTATGESSNNNGTEQQGNNANNNNSTTTETAPTGTRENPVVIDDDEDGAAEETIWTRASRRIESFFNLTDSYIISPIHLILALGFIVPLTILAPLLLNGAANEGIASLVYSEYGSSGVLQMTTLAIVLHSLMAFAAYRVLRNIIDSGGLAAAAGEFPGLARRRKLTVAQISDILGKVAVEEFVSKEDVQNGECSVARMKRMLVNRGESGTAELCVEREELVQAIIKVRNYNEECAVCAEEYVEGDAMRVTHCKHEFHLHCFDKWIYTFATESRSGHPSCPLCKATIK